MDEIAINQRTPANWDDDSDDEEENKTGEPSSIQPSPSQTAAIVKPKKKSLGQKISEREARQSDLESASKDQFQEEEEESIQKRKEREHNLIQQSDLQNAQDLFAQTSLQNGSCKSLKPIYPLILIFI